MADIRMTAVVRGPDGLRLLELAPSTVVALAEGEDIVWLGDPEPRMVVRPAPRTMLVSADPTPITRAEEVGTVVDRVRDRQEVIVEVRDKRKVEVGDRVWVGR